VLAAECATNENGSRYMLVANGHEGLMQVRAKPDSSSNSTRFGPLAAASALLVLVLVSSLFCCHHCSSVRLLDWLLLVLPSLY
jgi:hypothetical protein